MLEDYSKPTVENPFTTITFSDNSADVIFFLQTGDEKMFVDKICKAVYGTSYSELIQEQDNLCNVIDSKNAKINELLSQIKILRDDLDEANNENLRLDQELHELKCTTGYDREDD